MIKRLRWKFVIITMTIATVMLSIIFGMLYFFTKSNLETESIRMMQSVAQRPPLDNRPERMMPPEVRLPFFTVQINGAGEITAVSDGFRDSFFDLTDEDFIRNVVNEALKSNAPVGVLKEQGLRYFRGMTPMNQVIVFADITSERNTLENLRSKSMLIGVLSFSVLLGLSTLLGRWAVKPVDTAWKQQRQFVSDASHELKTPLTVIITNAQMLQSPDYDEDSRQKFTNHILEMSKQMRKLLEQMLALARSDSGQNHPAHAPVNMSTLVSNGILPFEPVFFEQGLTLESEITGNIFVDGAEQQLRQLLEILLDNAQKYASAGAVTKVTLERHAKSKCVLTVANEGEPIPPEHLSRLFGRFYRADEARTRDGSFGLGLAIAQSIVTQHRGKIRAESKHGFNRFITELSMIQS